MGNYAAYVLVSLALYGAILSTTYTGAAVSIERAQGWSRQLRLTPLSPAAYIGMKVATALVLGFVSIAVVNVVGIVTHKASMPVYLWIVSALCVWIGVHVPLLGGGLQWTWIVNVVAWLAIFAGVAIWRFGKDTARV